jgi:hypothetical protein
MPPFKKDSMATIRKRKGLWVNSWEVMIRRAKVPPYYISFATEEEARAWVKENEENYISNPHLYQRMSQQSQGWLDRRRKIHTRIDPRIPKRLEQGTLTESGRALLKNAIEEEIKFLKDFL